MYTAALVAVVVLAGASSEENLKIGEAYVQRGAANKAIPLLKKALSDDKLPTASQARAHAAMGTALLQKKKPADAVKSLELATKLAPTEERSWLLLSMAQDGAGQFPASIEALREGANKNPKSWRLRHELGMLQLEAGQAKAAVKTLDEAVKIQPRQAELLTDHAYALTLIGAFERARDSAMQAVSMAPRSPDAYYNLGSAEAGLKQEKKARAAFDQALHYEPLHTPSLYRLGVLELGAGESKKAAKHFMQVVKIDPDNKRAKAQLGIALGQLKRDKNAKKLLAEAVHIDPSFGRGHAMLGDIAEREKDFDAAVKHYRALQKLRPKDSAVKARVDALVEKRDAARKAGKK